MNIELREEVKWFAGEMESQLRRNEHKGGWKECSSVFLVTELMKNLEELNSLTMFDTKGDKLTIIRRAANIANFAMMIADNARKMRGNK